MVSGQTSWLRTEEETMNPRLAQSLVSDHIRQARQQAAAIRRVGAARGSQRKSARATRRGSHGAREA
jgi:hypothetical protein